MTDISNNIIYPSFFKINYEDTKNTFYLESLTLSNLKLWKKSILIDTSNNITVQHKEFSKLIINLKACLTEKLLLVNNSFTNKPLLLGNIFLYYCQYLSQHVFNNPYTIEPFMQNKILKKSFFSFIDNLIDSLYNKEYLNEDHYFFTVGYIGIPIYLSIKNNHLSLEHTHPPHEYILSNNKFKKISELKKEFNEIIT